MVLRPRIRPRFAGEEGQASVELVAVLPVVVLLALTAWQLAVAGHTAWQAAGAARVAARADAVGRSPRAAARSALPDSLERHLEVARRKGGGVRVSVRVPIVAGAGSSPLAVSAQTSLGRSR